MDLVTKAQLLGAAIGLGGSILTIVVVLGTVYLTVGN